LIFTDYRYYLPLFTPFRCLRHADGFRHAAAVAFASYAISALFRLLICYRACLDALLRAILRLRAAF